MKKTMTKVIDKSRLVKEFAIKRNVSKEEILSRYLIYPSCYMYTNVYQNRRSAPYPYLNSLIDMRKIQNHR